MATLTLPLKKKWFDLIKAGIKKEEYRECSDYWISRFNKLCGCFEYVFVGSHPNCIGERRVMISCDHLNCDRLVFTTFERFNPSATRRQATPSAGWNSRIPKSASARANQNGVQNPINFISSSHGRTNDTDKRHPTNRRRRHQRAGPMLHAHSSADEAKRERTDYLPARQEDRRIRGK